MSEQNLLRFLKVIDASTHLSERIGTRIGYDDFLAVARDHGFDLSDVGLEKAMQFINTFAASNDSGFELELVKCSAPKK